MIDFDQGTVLSLECILARCGSTALLRNYLAQDTMAKESEMAVSHTSPKAVSPEATEDLTVEMHAELVQIRSDLAALMKTVASLGKKVAADIQVQTLAATGELAESSSNAIKGARQQVSTLEKEVAAQVKEKPLHALLLALGLGFLISLLIRR